MPDDELPGDGQPIDGQPRDNQAIDRPPTDRLHADADWIWLRGEIQEAAAAFADQLRSIPDGSVKVPNLDWDVRELGAHLVSLPDFYRELNAATEPFEAPDDWVAFSEGVRADLADATLEELAERLEPDAGSFLRDLGDDGSAPWTLYVPTTTGKTAAGYLGELLMHGMDLARLTGARVTMSDRHGHAIIDAMMTLAPFFVDPEAAAKCPGVYHLHFRGGRDYTYTIAEGALAVTDGRPARADARMSAGAAAFVLVAMGRMGQVRAGLTGKIVAYGRKPWRFAQVGDIAVDGI